MKPASTSEEIGLMACSNTSSRATRIAQNRDARVRRSLVKSYGMNVYGMERRLRAQGRKCRKHKGLHLIAEARALMRTLRTLYQEAHIAAAHGRPCGQPRRPNADTSTIT